MTFFDMVTQWDLSVLEAIQNIKSDALDLLMMIFSYMGEAGAIWIFAAITMLCFKKTKVTGAMILFALIAGVLIGEVALKNIVCRPRPFVTFPDLSQNINPPDGYSFPSGHSCSSFAAATILLLRDKRFGLPALLVAALIAFSRLYNCVHFPTDVLAGILLGISLGVITVIFFKKTKLDDKLSRPLMYKHTPADDVNQE